MISQYSTKFHGRDKMTNYTFNGKVNTHLIWRRVSYQLCNFKALDYGCVLQIKTEYARYFWLSITLTKGQTYVLKISRIGLGKYLEVGYEKTIIGSF